MTRAQFIDAFKHELAGIVLDAAVTSRKGAELALWSRMIMQKIDAKIGVMYDTLLPPKIEPAKDAPAKNGQPPAGQSPAQPRK